MKLHHVVIALLVIFVAVLAVLVYQQRGSKLVGAPVPTPIQQPVWQWTQIGRETLVFQPGEGRVGYDIPQGDSRPRKIVISARSPLQLSYIPTEFRQQMIADPQGTLKLAIFTCLQQHVLQTEYRCNIPNGGYSLVLRDERTLGDALGAGFAAALGLKGPANQQLIRNDVSIQTLVWECVRNCNQPAFNQDHPRQHLPAPG